MSEIAFTSFSATTYLDGIEGHYLTYVPRQLTLGLLEPNAPDAYDRLAGFIDPGSQLHQQHDVAPVAFGRFFCGVWHANIAGNFAWRGIQLDTYHVSLNTAMALGGDPMRLACHFDLAGYAWVDGPERAWLAAVIAEGLAIGLLRPGRGWREVATMLEAREDEPVVIDHDGFPNPYLGGWIPPELGNDYGLLTEQQQAAWGERVAAFEELDEVTRWGIALEALRTNRRAIRMRPGSFGKLRFGLRVTALDLVAPDRAARLDQAIGLESASG